MAGRGMMKHLPKFGLVRSCYKFLMLLIIYGINVAAFVAGLAKAADDVDKTHKEFRANVQAFLMTLSYELSAANCLHEPNEKERAWNVFKFLMLVALFLVDVYLLQVTYSKKGKDISAEDKEHYATVIIISAGLAAIPFVLRLDNKRHWLHLALVVLVKMCIIQMARKAFTKGDPAILFCQGGFTSW
ncbi:hypothetical protein RHMOL_Rhmol05G0021700 [Rhododendron molle]|uniref:Uncharacterized protein n=1 Tax=Rhododendron molle TaxID=49168 RepID=A0ACC0NJS7_RHOML|nr:hypothetical protein RHMOL_Rhmol05G0021700 [Rhododendron molle]